MIRLFFILTTLGLLYSCANELPPTGGPEDLHKPRIVRGTPENKSTNFKGNTITLEFDEFVNIDLLEGKMLITPTYTGKVKKILKGKKVILEFEEPLDSNTTYTIYMAGGIKDITRGNLVDTTITFSTGPYLDSLTLEGKVYELPEMRENTGIMVGLYKITDTLNPEKQVPYYYTTTTLKGKFSFKNLKEGEYALYAIHDRNNNLKFDPGKEKIAYQKTVSVKQVQDEKIELYTSAVNKIKPIVSQVRYKDRLNTIRLNKGVEYFNIETNLSEIMISKDGKEINIFDSQKLMKEDSIKTTITLTDSSGNTNTLPLTLFFSGNLKTETVLDKNQIIEYQYNNNKISYKIRTDYPISDVDKSLIIIKKDTNLVTQETVVQKVNSTTLLFTVELDKDYDSLVYTFLPGAVSYLDKKLEKEIKFSTKLLKTRDLAVLGGKLIGFEGNYLFELLDPKFNVLQSENNVKSFYYKNILPGAYQMRIILDKNGNGKWDAADLEQNLPAEKIVYYKEKIALRANWEIIDIKFENDTEK